MISINKVEKQLKKMDNVDHVSALSANTNRHCSLFYS